jgi:dipeptidyl aminopeptidase/acylaminoacyl peptidase
MTFRRVLQILGLLLGFMAGLTAATVAYFTRRMVNPPRQALWTSPAQMGLPYENVQFPARDGVRLSGWFLPAAKGEDRHGATLILVHGWSWNRLGDAAADLLANFSGTTPVELLRLAHALHYEGYNVLMYDQRNHGESASHSPVTFGLGESEDLMGAIAYLAERPEADKTRIGAIGFSIGANAILYALPRTDELKAAIAVQPTTASIFAGRYAEDMLGPLGNIVRPLVESAYAAAGDVRLAALQPAFAVAGAGSTPVLFIQGKQDPWGSIEDVERLAAATPGGVGPLFVDGTHHYHGYQYLIENPRVAVTFFEQYL